jgi:translocation and assembly module TamB
LSSPQAGNLCLHAKWDDKKIVGNIDLHITRFGFLKAWSKDFDITGGQLLANLKLGGAINQPSVTGSINLNQGSIVIPKANLTLNNISASITHDQNQLDFKAQAYSHNQPIHLQGSLHLAQSDVVGQATLTSNNALIIDTDQFKAFASANLNATMKNAAIFITGTIHIPTANIKPNDFQAATTLPDNDIVYTGVIIHPPESMWSIHSNVLVTMGNHVHLHVTGIDAMLGGQVQITREPRHEYFGTGSIFVRNGIYKVYGQTLTIAPNSSMNFENSLLNNPSLNLKASKIVHAVTSTELSSFSERKLTVGIELRGTIKMPKITFFSNRDLPQTDILSYLLLGYASSSDAPGNTDLLLRALAAVDITSQGLLGKENIAEQLQSSLGLSEMGVESETTTDTLGNPLNQQSAFVVGKHLTKKLYVRYSIGILDPVNVVELRYLLSKRWMVQMDSSTLGNDTGADVLYRIEKN